jgi:hypothetical protein
MQGAESLADRPAAECATKAKKKPSRRSMSKTRAKPRPGAQGKPRTKSNVSRTARGKGHRKATHVGQRHGKKQAQSKSKDQKRAHYGKQKKKPQTRLQQKKKWQARSKRKDRRAVAKKRGPKTRQQARRYAPVPSRRYYTGATPAVPALPVTPAPVARAESNSSLKPFYSTPPTKVSPPRNLVPIVEKEKGQHLDFDGYNKKPSTPISREELEAANEIVQAERNPGSSGLRRGPSRLVPRPVIKGETQRRPPVPSPSAKPASP